MFFEITKYLSEGKNWGTNLNLTLKKSFCQSLAPLAAIQSLVPFSATSWLPLCTWLGRGSFSWSGPEIPQGVQSGAPEWWVLQVKVDWEPGERTTGSVAMRKAGGQSPMVAWVKPVNPTVAGWEHLYFLYIRPAFFPHFLQFLCLFPFKIYWCL